jgi:hypothetical protein
VSRKRKSSARLAAEATGRRSIRLGGTYFVTICTARRGLVFGWTSDGKVLENGNASIVHDCWSGLPNHYPHVSLDAFVVMPEHIHGIIVLLDTRGVGEARTDNARAGSKPAPLQPEPNQRVPDRLQVPAAEEIHVN